MTRSGKRPSIQLLLVALVAILLAPPATARRHNRHKAMLVAGTFDYYVMSLSWSPQHCATASGGAGDLQCRSTRNYGFVLHGLWPQYESGYPQSCATDKQLTDDVIDGMLDIMPSKALVEHEWSKHGTCSDLTAQAYFAKARAAFMAVKMPVPYDNPTAAFRTSVSKVKDAFQGTNPRLNANKMAVRCSGRFLQEVQVCLDKDLQPRACGHGVQDACGGDITVRPVK